MSDDLRPHPLADPTDHDDPVAAMDQNSSDGLFELSPVRFNDESAGLKALYDPDHVPQTHDAMLDAIFERMVRSLKISLRKIASDQVEVSLNSITTTRYRSYMESVSLPALLAVVKASPWGGHLLIIMSARLVYGLVEATLGGAAKGTTGPIEGRAFTVIETRIAHWLIDALIADAEEAFSTVSPVTFELDHTETIPRFINIAPPSSIAVLISVSVQIGDLATTVEILIPLSTLDPVRELHAKVNQHEQLPRDDLSAKALHDHILRSKADLEAVLHEEEFTLERVMALGVGDTLMFERGPNDPVEVRCNGIPIAFGRAGRSGQRLAVEVQSCPDAAR